jgi:hypothetical protein
LCAQRIFDHEKLARAIAVAVIGKLRPRSHACSSEVAMVGYPIFDRGGARRRARGL